MLSRIFSACIIFSVQNCEGDARCSTHIVPVDVDRKLLPPRGGSGVDSENRCPCVQRVDRRHPSRRRTASVARINAVEAAQRGVPVSDVDVRMVDRAAERGRKKAARHERNAAHTTLEGGVLATA